MSTYEVEVIYDRPYTTSPVLDWFMIRTTQHIASGKLKGSGAREQESGAETVAKTENYIRMESHHFCDNRDSCILIGEMSLEIWWHDTPRYRERCKITVADDTRVGRRMMRKDWSKMIGDFTKRGWEVTVK